MTNENKIEVAVAPDTVFNPEIQIAIKPVEFSLDNYEFLLNPANDTVDNFSKADELFNRLGLDKIDGNGCLVPVIVDGRKRVVKFNENRFIGKEYDRGTLEAERVNIRASAGKESPQVKEIDGFLDWMDAN